MSNTKHAFELLRQANPAPFPRDDTAESHLVLRIALTAIAVIAFLLVAPALGLRLPPIDFWSAEKAPPRIVQEFDSLGIGAPPGMDPNVIPGETRKVATFQLSDGAHALWVAPTKDGGFCTTITKLGGGCDKLGTVPLSVSWMARRVPKELMGPNGRSPQAFEFIDGHVDADYVHSLEIRFADGEVLRPEIVWVSEPINAGFFAYEIPEHRRIASVVALDESGELVSEDRWPRPSGSEPPAEALLGEKRRLIIVETREGTATLWQAPTRYEGRCEWLEFRERVFGLARCRPKGYPNAGLAMRWLPTHKTVLLLGEASRNNTLELVFEDGARQVVRPREGFLLFELAQRQVEPGRRVSDVVLRNARGEQIVRIPGQTNANPCQAPALLPEGVDPDTCG